MAKEGPEDARHAEEWNAEDKDGLVRCLSKLWRRTRFPGAKLAERRECSDLAGFATLRPAASTRPRLRYLAAGRQAVVKFILRSQLKS